MKRLYYLFLVTTLTANIAKAQDIHFSQFFASPLTLNPALAGNFDGNLRVAGNYRGSMANYTTGLYYQHFKRRFPDHGKQASRE